MSSIAAGAIIILTFLIIFKTYFMVQYCNILNRLEYFDYNILLAALISTVRGYVKAFHIIVKVNFS